MGHLPWLQPYGQTRLTPIPLTTWLVRPRGTNFWGSNSQSVKRQVAASKSIKWFVSFQTTLVKYTLQRDYIMANEAYMEMAIGNAPWPIGVTNA
jgi:Prp18 domain